MILQQQPENFAHGNTELFLPYCVTEGYWAMKPSTFASACSNLSMMIFVYSFLVCLFIQLLIQSNGCDGSAISLVQTKGFCFKRYTKMPWKVSELDDAFFKFFRGDRAKTGRIQPRHKISQSHSRMIKSCPVK